jgi:ATP-dependent Clp protease ATP-binding subunit ClpA
LETELFNELGTEGVAELKSGHWDVLADVLPNKVDQIAVTQEYLGVVAERTGDETYNARAAELQQDKIDAIVAERIAERSVRPGRGFELDDDMEL